MSKSIKKTRKENTVLPPMIPLNRKPQVIRVKLGHINLHNSIPTDTLAAMASVAHKIGGASIFSQDAIELFLKFHPIIISKTGNHKYSCFGGIRSYQLARRHFDRDHSVDALVYSNIEDKEVSRLAVLDSYLSTLGFALDSYVWEVDLLRMWTAVGPEYLLEMTPELKNKISLAQKMNINRKRLSPLHHPPESALRKEMQPVSGQEVSSQNPAQRAEQEESVSTGDQDHRLEIK